MLTKLSNLICNALCNNEYRYAVFKIALLDNAPNEKMDLSLLRIKFNHEHNFGYMCQFVLQFS